MRQLLVAGIAAAAFWGAPAFAADMAVKAPIAAPLFSWTGLYVGGNVGGAWSQTKYLSNHIQCVAGNNFTILCDPVDHRASSVAGGGQLGARWQRDHWVVGLDGSLDATSLSKTTPSFLVPASLNYSSELRTIYTGTVQAGYAWDRTLWYVKGGYAGGEMKLNSITIPVGTLGPAKTNLNGWTVGSGIEYAWQNLSVGLEYDYIRLEGGATTCAPNNPASVFTCAGGLPLRYANIASDVQQVVVRLNYKLGDPWGKAAVVAKY